MVMCGYPWRVTASEETLLRAATEQINDRGYLITKLEEAVR